MTYLSQKPISRALSGVDQSVLCRLKWNPREENEVGGTKIDDADMAVGANSITLRAQAIGGSLTGDTAANSYTGASGAAGEIVFADANIASVQNLIDAINGVAAGQTASRRWRAGLADFRPQFVIGALDGLVTSAAKALLGEFDEGLPVLADASALGSVNMIAIGLGTERALAGAGQSFPDHFQSEFTVNAAGERVDVRAAARRRAEQPGLAKTQVILTGASVGVAYATNKQFSVYDDDGNLLFREEMGGGSGNTALDNAAAYDENHPIAISRPGGALFIEVTGTGALTDGPVTVQGFERRF